MNENSITNKLLHKSNLFIQQNEQMILLEVKRNKQL